NNGYGIGLVAWNGQPGLVLANNVVYNHQGSPGAYTIQLLSGTSNQGILVGNVVAMHQTNNTITSGVRNMSTGYVIGQGLTDFTTPPSTGWGNNYSYGGNFLGFRPSDTGAIIGTANVTYLVPEDITNTLRLSPHEAGALDGLAGGGGGAPTTSGMNPNTIAYNAPSPVITLNGTNFPVSCTIGTLKVGALAVPCTQVMMVNAAQLTYSLTPAQTLSLGVNAHNVTVTSGSQTSNAQQLVISAPILLNVTPSAIEYNTNPPINLQSNYFGANPSVKIGSVTFSSPTITLPDMLRVNPSLDQVNNNLGVGLHTVLVINTLINSNSKTLTITDPTPTLTNINPNSVQVGGIQQFTLSGSKFTPYSKVRVGTLPLLTPDAVNPNGNSLTFTLTATQTQLLGVGPHNVFVVNGSRTSNGLILTITEAPAILTLISPQSVEEDSDYTIALTGSNFQTYSEILVGNLPPISPNIVNQGGTLLRFNLTAAQIQALGGAGSTGSTDYPVRVRNAPGIVSNSMPLTVTSQTSANNPPGNFDVVATTGPSARTVNVAWDLAGGTAPVDYILRGILASHPIALDGIIDSGEFEGGTVWDYDQTNPSNPFLFTGMASTDYCFAAKATNAYGFSYSTTSCATARSSDSPPGSFT
ncbi:MAG: IPT/TIG domain-containing protein, partial [archaeon]|nr:IPT/TIG domain-containing protein [archaeon]